MVLDVKEDVLQNWPVHLRGERVLMREPLEKDRAELIRLVTNPHARKYLGGAIGFASRQALELSPLGLTWGHWVIAHGATDTMIGTIALKYDRKELELSFALLPEFVGQGYAGEALDAVINFAKQELPDESMIAVTQSSNKRSVELLKRKGFTVRRGMEEFGTQQFLMELNLKPLSSTVNS